MAAEARPMDEDHARALPLVVVIEDDPASRKTLARVLRPGGYEPVLYDFAEAFLSSPPQSSPIGLLLDVHRVACRDSSCSAG